jgi:hypothetical protein
MARSPTKSNDTAAASSPAKAASAKAVTSNPTQEKFGNAFNQVRNETFASSPTQGKVEAIAADHEILAPLVGTCLITFLQHGKAKHPHVCLLLMSFTDNTQ